MQERSYTITPEAIDWDFIKQNIVFAASPVNMGYGMRNPNNDKSQLQLVNILLSRVRDYCIKKQKKLFLQMKLQHLAPYGYKEGDVMVNKPAGLKHWEISFEEYKRFLRAIHS